MLYSVNLGRMGEKAWDKVYKIIKQLPVHDQSVVYVCVEGENRVGWGGRRGWGWEKQEPNTEKPCYFKQYWKESKDLTSRGPGLLGQDLDLTLKC